MSLLPSLVKVKKPSVAVQSKIENGRPSYSKVSATGLGSKSMSGTMNMSGLVLHIVSPIMVYVPNQFDGLLQSAASSPHEVMMDILQIANRKARVCPMFFMCTFFC